MVSGITFGGLVSGLDTESIIKALVDVRREGITKLQTQSDDLGFYKSVLRNVNSNLLSFQKASLNLRLESTFKTKKVSLSSENYITAKAGYKASPGSYIMEVKRLARGAAAISGLNDRAFMRGAAALIQNNTAGVTGVEVTETNLGGVRATMESLITETLQAGRGSTAVNAGDQITITGTTKNGSAVNATFTFNGDSTDTIQRLANTVSSAFRGEVDVQIDSNGALMLVEKDTYVAGNFSLTGFNFVDADYSGSTLSVGIGTSIASGGPQAHLITGNRTFTTGSSANIATAATLLDSTLDQITGGNLDGSDDKIHITGKDHDGNAIDAYYSYTVGDSFQALLDSIETAYGSNVTATMENGKIVVTDNSTGASQFSMALSFEDAGATTNTFSLGIYITTRNGVDETEQVIKTQKFETPAIGRYLLDYSEGKGGQVTGTVALTEDTLLGNIAGLTSYNVFTVDRDTGSGTVSPVTIFGINERSSVRDLINAINAQVPDVTAGLVSDGAGQYNLQITANRGGEEIRLSDVAGGILDSVLNPSGGVDTDWTTANSTTATDDFTATARFTSNTAVPGIFRTIVTADEGSTIDNLITNMSISGTGTGHEFGPGFALVYTNESSELNIQPATHAHIIGATGIALNETTPRLNLLATLADAGFSTTPQNATDNPTFHTDGFFTINGKRIEIDDAERMTVNEVIGKINSSGAGVIASYDTSSDRFILRSTTSGSAGSITLGGGGDTSNFLAISGLAETSGGVLQVGNDAGKIDPDKLIAYSGFTFLPGSGTFTINGVTIYIDQATDTLNTVIQKINNSGAGVKAIYDPNNDRIALSQDLNSQITFDRITVGDASDTSAFLASIRLTDNPSVTKQIGTQREQAEIILDGTTYYRDSNTVNDLIAEVTLDLKSVTLNPVSLDITVDTERAISAIAEFVVQYNTLMAIVNPQPLSDDEREEMVPLTDSDISTMTGTQIDDYNAKLQSYQERDTIFNDSSIRRLNYQLRNMTFNPVVGASADLNALSTLGIDTGIYNAGLADAKTPYLVEDTLDVDTIKQKLQETPELLDALNDRADEVFSMFSNPSESTVEVKGTRDILLGIDVTTGLRFQVGSGGRNVVVEFEPGHYTYAQVINRIQDSLNNGDLTDELYVGLDKDNQIILRNSTESGRASVYVFDLNAGDSLSDKLGITSGINRGADAEQSAGLGIRLDNFIKSYTGVGGIFQRRITTGGQIDREISSLSNQINQYEDRLTQYEQRLRMQYTAMEVELAKLQKTSQYLTSQAASLQKANQS